MRDRQFSRGLGHAPSLSHREDDVKIAQPDTAADPVRPVHFRPLSLYATGMSKDLGFSATARRGRIFNRDRHNPKEAMPMLVEGTAMPRKCFLGTAVVAISIA